MLFKRFIPQKGLEKFVECYWVIESDDTIPAIQKIIPDGFPEIIFHYRAPYQININGSWQLQSSSLLAGQIKKYFFLQNSGASGVFGIKFKPPALTHLFNVSMNEFTDKVVAVNEVNISSLTLLEHEIKSCSNYEEMIIATDKRLQAIVARVSAENTIIDRAIDIIFATAGTISITEIQKQLFITERHLQRIFQKYIGISPKFYTRIIRFGQIFHLMQQANVSWLDITHRSGYFDQSHFIKDFKAFSGEDPSKYFFDTPNMANFFLKK
jgi:AraC-like DNA-binding protein